MGVSKRSHLIELPFPPSVNTYWRRVGAKTVISKKGRQYRERVQRKVEQLNLETLESRCAVSIYLMWPDRRVRDLDNYPKSLLDSLMHGGLLKDDCSDIVARLTIEHSGYQKGGAALVQVNEL